jgi:hypothetical protein
MQAILNMNRNRTIFILTVFLALLPQASAAQAQVFPYGHPPEEKPDMPLSAALNRLYDNYSARWPHR